MDLVLLALQDAHEAALWRDELLAGGRCQVLGPARSFAEVRLLMTRSQPTVLVSDVRLFDGVLTDLVRVMRNGGRYQAVPVLAVSADEQDPLLLEALQAGADSLFVGAEVVAGQRLSQVQDTLAGGAHIAPWIARRLLDHFGQRRPDASAQYSQRRLVEDLTNPLSLSAHEEDLLCQLAVGLRLNEVARRAGLLPKDLTASVRRIYRKMQWALRAGDLTLA